MSQAKRLIINMDTLQKENDALTEANRNLLMSNHQLKTYSEDLMVILAMLAYRDIQGQLTISPEEVKNFPQQILSIKMDSEKGVQLKLKPKPVIELI